MQLTPRSPRRVILHPASAGAYGPHQRSYLGRRFSLPLVSLREQPVLLGPHTQSQGHRKNETFDTHLTRKSPSSACHMGARLFKSAPAMCPRGTCTELRRLIPLTQCFGKQFLTRGLIGALPTSQRSLPSPFQARPGHELNNYSSQPHHMHIPRAFDARYPA